MIAYAITDPSTLNFNTLDDDLKRFATRADMIVYRDKSTTNYAQNATQFVNLAREHNFSKILLHTDYQLAHRLEADGVHLKSTQFTAIKEAKALGLFVIVSTHTVEEAYEVMREGADMITLSPIFSTPNKGEAKGVAFLLDVANKIDIPIIALGGILTQEQIEACSEHGASGFASIRYFSTP